MNFKKYLIWRCIALSVAFISAQSFMSPLKGQRAYNVSLSGDDANPGTQAAPYKTIAKINNIHLLVGDGVYFKSGQTFEGTIKIDSNITGSKAFPIIIASYGNGRAIINGGNENGIVIKGASFISVKNLLFQGSGRKTGNTKDGIYLTNANHVTLNNLDIQGFQKSGLLIYASKSVIAKDISSHDNGSAGITVEGPYTKREAEDIQIINCRAENNPGDPTNLTNHSGNGIVVGNCRNVLIDHCTATNNGWDMPRIGNGPVGIWAYEADSVTIQHCLSYGNKTSKGGADGGGFDLDGGVTNSVVQYCLSYGNEGSGYCIFQYWGASPWHHNIFRYNISENDGTVSDSQAGLYVWNSSDDEKQFHDCDVYGNIIYNSKVAAISFSDKSESKGLRFFDNIFVGKDSLIKGKDKIGDAKYMGNDWWSIESGFNIDGSKDLKTWAIKTGKEQKNGKIIGFNIKPHFKSPGKAAITSASQLRNFTNYELRQNSHLRKMPVYAGKNGINKLKMD